MNTYPIPRWKVTVAGTDVTDRIRPRLIDLTLTEARKGEADELELKIHDHDGRVEMPKRGETIKVSIGFHDSGLIEKGTFKVDEVEHSGSPDIITIRARSADLTHQLRNRRERSWHDVTLGAILENIAGEHSLKPSIDKDLGTRRIDHLDQTNESDVNLLQRLAKRFDAVATVKNGALIFQPIGKGETAGGLKLPTAVIERASGDQHRYSLVDRDSEYSGVTASYHDKKTGKKKDVTAGEKGNAKKIRKTFATEQEAKENADAEQRRVKRAGANFSYTMAIGRPDLYPEMKITVKGFKKEIDSEKWIIARATHTITGSAGFTTQLELERDS